MRCRYLALILLAAHFAVTGPARSDELYTEPLRPQLHFSPATQWMNDPNGMVYFDGEYHLFYQYHPYSTRWGPMHWGHAVSRDLVHWEQLPIALYPDEHGAIFSGSAVVDRDNTSGFGSAERPPLVAVFAYHDMSRERPGATDIESQGIAYSLDRGRSWTKYAGNPVLKNPGVRDFRDPKVFWHAATRRWVMTLASKDQVIFYSSADLKAWRRESAFGRGLGEHGGVWECPDLIEMSVDGGKEHRYVLLVSVNPGAPNGGSGTQYFIGQFDGHRFRLERAARWLDYGTDNYAGVTWSGVPASDGRTPFLGWMSNWDYAQDVPTAPWRSAMTLPRELKLVRSANGLMLRATPVAELETLRARNASIVATRVQAPTELIDAAASGLGPVELQLTLTLGSSTMASLAFHNAQQEEVVLHIDRLHRRYELDRSRSGALGFSDKFARVQTAPMTGRPEVLALQVYLDRSSVEIFIDHGETVMTALAFPGSPYNAVRLSADAPVTVSAGVSYQLDSIWSRAYWSGAYRDGVRHGFSGTL
jgi:fructan beta-fructosidase